MPEEHSPSSRDPLEQILALLDARGHVSTGLIAGGHWAVAFPAPDDVKFNVVRKGRCVLRVDGGEPVPLAPGDCYLLTHPRPFTLSSDLETAAVPAGPLFAAATGGMAHAGDGEDVALIGGRFSFGERARTVLLDALPPVIHVPAETIEADALRWALDQIDLELRAGGLGSTLVAEHLAIVMLVHVLRRVPSAGSGLLAGLADPVVGPALRSLHGAPSHAWTVAELAGEAAVSRSTLAARFSDVVGQGPLDYLTGWRMELASARLRSSGDTLAVVARAVGYGSESAFSTAFKRVVGVSPREYRRREPEVVGSPAD
ncbi:AraC family transcriptional regulator [Cryptosporangium phraense]|uniref:AraC family transcriptional regulator n=1 Tax=Cryptosporangium phraense TaxID=2593070 RepID=A0A545AZL9_9ACTN|nr:AraC family transcriptional regulator [Cryptosporangium phraense]TQS46055.1 AraC family transcriptional regulator [Cryptosporangium phraense]